MYLNMEEAHLQIKVTLEGNTWFSVIWGFLLNQADAYFAGLLVCPVCKSETRHYTKDTHDIPVSKMCRIWCEGGRVVQM